MTSPLASSPADHATSRLVRMSLPVLLGIATIFGVSSTIQAYWLSVVSGDKTPMVGHLFVLNCVYWYVPALVAPIVVRIATVYQVGRGRGYVAALVHITGALVYSVVHTTAMLATRALLMPPPERGWWLVTRIEWLRQLDWLFMTYLFFLGVAHALAYRRENERRALDSAHLETRLIEAQLQALQHQLHPHFLFNTLNAIAGLMRSDVETADRMIDRLGDLLRMTLHGSSVQEVPLREELDVLQKYTDIEQVRFGDRLTVSVSVPPDALDVLVPNFLLQPLVENAVRHGVAPRARPGHINLTAALDERALVLTLTDSGDGVPSHRLTLLNEGVGLANTRARLEHLYPGRHSLTFANTRDGFQVVVRIPHAAARAAAAEPARIGAA